MRRAGVLMAAGLLVVLGCVGLRTSSDQESGDQRPLLLQGVGQCSFPATTSAPRVQAYIDQGICMIHGYWYYEAWRSFREAARLDSTCAIAYWGMHQSLVGNNSNRTARRQALRRAQSLMGGASSREQGYIRAAVLLDSLPRQEGRPAFIEAMETLAQQYPEDVEAPVFLARYLMRGFDFDQPVQPGEPDLRPLLSRLIESHPRHPAPHHYWIHLVEAKHPDQGLESARHLEELVWNAGHLVHMPGHIYYRLGQYERARQSFIASMKVDSTYMAVQGVAPERTWNYVHNLNYLLATCAEEGRYREGLQWARRLQAVPLSKRKSLFFYQGRLALPRLHIRLGLWGAAARELAAIAANDTLTNTFAAEYARGMEAYARGMEAVQTGTVEVAEQQLKVLAEFEWVYAIEGPPSDDIFYTRRRLDLLGVARLDLKGNMHRAKGEYPQARQVLEEAWEKAEELGYDEPPLYARSVLESLGYARLEAGAWQEAVAAFQRQLARRPGSGLALFGLAQAYQAGKQRQEAAQTYRAFLTRWATADVHLEQVKKAQAWLADQ
ncbi:MAG: tetratricopeptide repeat protein [Candidatus Latescibacteria bacterium]|nr:tetratricopeptide repeat protein [Candidatus Latescibacterota bacterium]